ncbi:MAG: 50S ribosomal protein L11 methyltransferase [Alphaproteobacteria bacterium]|nr:50S ribosomal protein L11 methyltransferase [Alphaproteobacteria bacterium]MDE2335974.1 50S ribosomal protein L11 methyltransferase [Alphaproteobacteria bacterium]
MTDANDISPHDLRTVRLGFGRKICGDLPEKLSDALEDLAVSVSLHNRDADDGDDWAIALTTLGAPDKEEILRRVAAVAEAENLPPLLDVKDISVEKLPEKDWLRHVHENFPPIATNRFFIYGSHYDGAPPQGLIPLQIDAATAFGSGEHETTRGCLDALVWLKEQGHIFKNGLDMGCGSGILAIAMTKLWPGIRVAAVDIDPESVTVTNRHAAMNGAAGEIKAAAGDGYDTELAERRAPYDVVTANILANPLVAMAPALVRALGGGGYAVLSGILLRQKEEVASAHENLGLVRVREETIDGWCALVFRK